MNEKLWFLKAYPFMVAQAFCWAAGFPETVKVKSVIGLRRFVGKTICKEKVQELNNKEREFKKLLKTELRKIDDKTERETKEKELEDKFFDENCDLRTDHNRQTNFLEIHIIDNSDREQKLLIKDWDTKPTIDTWHTSHDLLYPPHHGSGAIGVVLLTLPFTLLLSPVILTINGTYRLLEHAWGMTKGTYRLYSGLMNSNLFSDQEREIIRQACLNMELEWKETLKQVAIEEELDRELYTS